MDHSIASEDRSILLVMEGMNIIIINIITIKQVDINTLFIMADS